MAILMTRSAKRAAALPQQRDRARGEATLWTVGLEGVDVSAVRRAVASTLEAGSPWGHVRSVSGGGRRPVAPAEVHLWVDQVVRVAAAVDGDVARAHTLGADPLDRLPLAVVVTPDAVVLRWSQDLADRHQAEALLRELVRAATASATRRRLMGI